ncbi:MAG: hypothetical protein EA362_11485 [Saprospirales bacterium]|nr:MAG: hypothetical protein EA362_11485 [Saprospirales bacterium]
MRLQKYKKPMQWDFIKGKRRRWGGKTLWWQEEINLGSKTTVKRKYKCVISKPLIQKFQKTLSVS